MVKRPTKSWLAEEMHRAIDVALQYIGAKWPLEKRESILRPILCAIFPPNRRADAWGGYDQTIFVVKTPFYYPVIIPLGTPPDVWFKNLRLL